MEAPSSRPFRRLLLALVLTALAVRLYGIDWDQGRFYHPDERRIAEAVLEISFSPLSLDPKFFAYGSFPFYLARAGVSLATAVSPSADRYRTAMLASRAVSALFGALAVGLVALLGRRLYGERTGLLAAALLLGSALHLQASHFGTNDVVLASLVLLVLWLLVRAAQTGSLRFFASAGLVAGLALATKVSAAPVALPAAVAALLVGRRDGRLGRAALGLSLFGLLAAAGFLLGEPYALLSRTRFLHDVLEQGQMVRNAGSVPYTNQYVGTPKGLYELLQVGFWGLGPALGAAAVWGVARRLRPLRGRRPEGEWVLLAWLVPFSLVTASFDVKFPRYLLPIVPLLALFAARALRAVPGSRGRVLRGAVGTATAAWALAFLSIYTRPHSAVTASAWLYENVPKGSQILTQDWDEGFPFSLPGGRSPDRFRVVTFPFYDEDSPGKMRRLAGELAKADAVALQTKRIYGAVTQAHEKFPLTSRAFALLFAGDLGFELAGDVASRPRLFGLELPTELADESISVYDHPRALVFRKVEALSEAALSERLQSGAPSRPMSRRDLLLARPTAADAGQPPPARVRSSGAAALLLAILVEALGLAGFALLRRSVSPRPGLYALGKLVGPLLFFWAAWLLASLGWVAFRPGGLLVLAALVVGTGALLRTGAAEGLSRREVVLTELLFWGSFAAFLGMRALNPEIVWGEKPMDFSFLNALYRATQVPPPEPWLAGSPLHYTYFGHFCAAALGKALGVEAGLQFNLAVAFFAALLAAGLLFAGAQLGGLRAGAWAVGLGLFAGNLAGVPELLARRRLDFDLFWAVSRVIPPGINEFPLWTFLFADLHAHAMALWLLAGLAGVLAALARAPLGSGHRTLVALASLFLGALLVTNGWSLPTAFGLVVASSLWAAWVASAGDRLATLGLGARRSLLVVASAYLLFAPFWLAFRPPVRRLGWEAGPWARPRDFVLVTGLALALLVPAALAALFRTLRGAGAGRLSSAIRVAAVAALLALSAVDLRSLGAGRAREAVWVLLLGVALTLLLLRTGLERSLPDRDRLPLALAAFAFAVLAGCELVFVWDRMNTVFKFYLDAGVLLAIASGAVAASLGTPKGEPSAGSRLSRRALFGAVLAFALATAALLPVSMLRPRRAEGPRWTLDGRAYLALRSPDEAAAFEWINRNVPGLPALAEAAGPAYQDFARVTMNTGLPSLLGWEYHLEQRGQAAAALSRRRGTVAAIYGARTKPALASLLARHRVGVVFSGRLEAQTYGVEHRGRFASWPDLLRPVFERGAVAVYQVADGVSRGRSEPPLRDGTALPAPPEPLALREPRGVAVDAQGRTYVADFGNDRVVRLDGSLALAAAWGSKGMLPGELDQPCGVAIGPDGSVHVADTWNGRIQVFDPDGRFVRELRADLFGPRALAVDGKGRVFVADTGNGRVVRLSPEGTFESSWGQDGPPGERLARPSGIAVDREGTVYVCDNDNGRLVLFDADGRFLRSERVPGWGPGVFSEPHVAVDPSGAVVVTVPLERRVAILVPGAPRQVDLPLERAPEGPRTPMGVALDGAGGAVVTLLEGDVVRVRLPHLGER